MLKQLSYIDLIHSIQDKVETSTELRCYDHVETNTPSPFYFAEIVRKRPANTKTMFRDIYTVYIHCIAEPNDSSVPVYNLIQQLDEALTEDIVLPEDYELILQTNNGFPTIKQDETKEKHAVVEFEFMICYGFKCKI